MQFSFFRMAARCAARPRLFLPALSAAWRFRRNGWYRRPPFLPLPPADYMQWRMHTAFGNDVAQPSIKELEAYLKWSAWMQKGGGHN